MSPPTRSLATLAPCSGNWQTNRVCIDIRFLCSATHATPHVAALEEQAYRQLQAHSPDGVPVFYRRRLVNTDKKVGNLTDWITNWGGAYDAMLVLDADSLMSGSAVRFLSRALSLDPQAGLIQSFPVVIRSETLFGRVQQFSNAVYGWLLAEGLATWSLGEGNYWGHNAIIRIRAFAEAAKLPYLKGRGGVQQLILSHDFVEAGMLRRAGWDVRFLPQDGSFEEGPQTLIDYAMRDRRWCQGNMQHLRILAARGFHPMSRFHLLQGAMGFLQSPIWMLMVLAWTLHGVIGHAPHRYFDEAAAPRVHWPHEPEISAWIYLVAIYGMLLLPKFLGSVALGLKPGTIRNYGGPLNFVGSVLFEILCSFVLAPIMMVQHSIAVIRAVFGLSKGWAPQARGSRGYGWRRSLEFHWIETGLGLLFVLGLCLGMTTLWLAPIAFSLLLAAPISVLSSAKLTQARLALLRLDTPQSLKEPRIIADAQQARVEFYSELSKTETPGAVATVLNLHALE